MRSHLPFIPFVSVLVAFGMLLTGSSAASAQQLGNKKELESAYNKALGEFRLLANGEAQPGPGTPKVAEAMAQWYIYRITHRAGVDPKEMVKVQTDFSDKTTEMMSLTLEKKVRNNKAFIRIFAPKLVESMKEVMTSNPLGKDTSATAIQAAIMLPSLARLRDDSVNDYLISLVKDTNTHDVIRLYAIKALREGLPITLQQDENTLDLAYKVQNDKRASDAKIVDALTRYIETDLKNKVAAAKSMTPEEVAAVRFLRREAIISLSHAGAPAVLALTKSKKQKEMLVGPVAPTLLRVLAGGVEPAPSLQEKIEAAIGLATMKHPNMPEYDPSAAAFLIGKTIVEFADEYNKELGPINAAGAGRKVPSIAYKTEAKRLADTLGPFADNAKIKQATELKAFGFVLLDSIKGGNAARPYPPLNADALRELRKNIPNWKTGNVFRTLMVK